ncbi:MAG: replication initiation protein [Sulfurimonas sp.]|jgi:plasmid replication initiation protein
MTKTYVATQSQEMIYSKMNYSLNEQKLLLTIIAQINSKSSEIEPKTITLKEMSEFYGKKVESRDLKRTLDSLNAHFWLKVDKSYIQTSMFSEIRVEEKSSDITFVFSKRVEAHLLNFNNGLRFVQTNIKNIIPLNCKHAIRIYQLLKFSMWEAKETKKDFFIELEELKKILMTPKSYNDFSLFNSYVLKPALEEINAHTDINFSYEIHKTKQKVTGISFKVEVDLLKSGRINFEAKEKFKTKFKEKISI